MAVSAEYLNFVLDQLSPWGGVTARRMFGGAGLYREGKMFGLLADDVAYLKVDDSNRDRFINAGSTPFIPFTDRAKATAMPYYSVPAEVLDNREALCQWARGSLEIQAARGPGPDRPKRRLPPCIP